MVNQLENNKILVFIGAFLFGFSIILIILAVFYMKQFDSTLTKSGYLEASLGWIGATLIGGGLALKIYSDASGGAGVKYGGDDSGDSAVWFITGVSFVLYALLATWLYIIFVPLSVLFTSLISSAFSFVGLIMVSYFATQGN